MRCVYALQDFAHQNLFFFTWGQCALWILGGRCATYSLCHKLEQHPDMLEVYSAGFTCFFSHHAGF